MKMKKFISILIICVLVLPALTIGVSAAVPYDRMIGLYNMENELKDFVSGGSGILWNGASFVDDADRGGKVLYLNNDNVETPGNGDGYDKEGQWGELAAPHIPNGGEMSVSIWFKVKELRTWARAIDLGDAKAQNALKDGETATVGPDRFVNISPTNGEFTIGTLNVNDSSAGVQNNRDRVFADLVDENKWIHAVYVISKDGNPNVLYINGKPYQSTHGGGGDDPEPAEFSPKDIFEAPSGLRNGFLGRSAYENNGDQIFNGYIDDVVIFDAALTAEQVAELMQADFKNGNPLTAVTIPAEVEQPAAPAAGDTGGNDAPAPAPEPPAPAAPATGGGSVYPPATGDSLAILAALTALSLVGAGIILHSKKTRV